MSEPAHGPGRGDPVADSETLLRFAATPGDQWDDNGRPTTAALSLRRNEEGLSVYAQDLLASRGLAPTAVIDDRPGYGLFSIPVASARRLGCDIIHDPVTAHPPRTYDFAHSMILRMTEKARWMAVRTALLDAAVVIFAPNG